MNARRFALVVLALLAIAALRDCARLGDALPWRQLYDFQDFYCAGSALDEGADPYAYEPLHRCEHRVNQSEIYRRDPQRAVPAPLPPYDFPPFMLAARLSFPAARAVDALAIVLAIVGCAIGLAMVGVPLDVAAAALLLPAGYLLLNAGQVIPFALLALVFCGTALARQRDALAGVLAALTLIEPHLGLPVCAALLLWVPASRVGLVATAAILAAAGALVVGIAGVSEYLLRVLPAQGGAEVGYIYQYSLTYLLHALGAPPAAALAAGELSYLGSLVFGLWLARRLCQAIARRELLAYFPAACALIGGAYVHMVDIAFALPAALVLANALQGRLRKLSVIALCLLAVPWIAAWSIKKLFLASLFVVAFLLVRLQADWTVVIATFCAIAAALYGFELSPPALPSVVTATTPFAPSELVQRAWRAYVAALGNLDPLWLVVKVPTWMALTALAVAAYLAGAPARSAPPRKS
jgi:hypothetical protein